MEWDSKVIKNNANNNNNNNNNDNNNNNNNVLDVVFENHLSSVSVAGPSSVFI